MNFMKRLVLLVLLAFVIVPIGYQIHLAWASARTVSWDPVTTYTDNTPIEASNTISYTLWRQDNVTKSITQLSTGITGVSFPFDDGVLVKGRYYNFWIRTDLSVGASSDNSAMYSWSLPLGKAATPAGLVVQ